MNFLGAADALKDIVADVPNVKVAVIGINQSWPSTPAVEVIPVGFDLNTIAAGNLDQDANGVIYIAVYVAMTANLEDDERLLLPIVEGVIDALRDSSLDRTLGGLVEDVRPTRVEFDVVKRNGRSYRSALVQLVVGDLTSAI